MTFELSGDYIELIKLLKFMHVASSGAQAKMMVEAGDVKLNGQTEFRKRAKLVEGDTIECMNFKITIRK
jgi:ribosome-associated protein